MCHPENCMAIVYQSKWFWNSIVQNRCKLVEKKMSKNVFFLHPRKMVAFKKKEKETSWRRVKLRVAPWDMENGACSLTIHMMKTPTAIGNYSMHVPIHGNTRKDRSRQSATEKRQKQSTQKAQNKSTCAHRVPPQQHFPWCAATSRHDVIALNVDRSGNHGLRLPVTTFKCQDIKTTSEPCRCFPFLIAVSHPEESKRSTL